MAEKIILGNIPSSVKTVVRKMGVVDAGLGVNLKSDGEIEIGHTYGISLGSPLEGGGGSAVAVDGYDIFVETLTGFNRDVGDPLYIQSTSGKACKDDDANSVLVNAIIEHVDVEAFDPSDLTGTTGKKTGVLVRINGGL